MSDFTDEELIEFYKKFDSLKKKFKEDKQYGFDLEADKFFLRVRPLKTQIYGLRVQCYFAYHLDFKLIPNSMDCGDFKTKAGHDIEFKCSFIDEEAQSINVKQIRQWQNLDYYYVFTVDYRDYRNIEYKCYELSKEDMLKECELMNAKPVANVKDKNNFEHASLGFSITLGSDNHRRWEEKYLNKKFNIKEIVNNSLNKIRTQKENEQRIKEQQEYIKQLEEKIKMLEIQEQAQEYEVNLELALCDRDYVNFKTLFKIQTMLGAIFQSNITYNRIISRITSKDLNFKINGTNYQYFLEHNKISNLLTTEEKKKVEEFILEYRLSD